MAWLQIQLIKEISKVIDRDFQRAFDFVLLKKLKTKLCRTYSALLMGLGERAEAEHGDPVGYFCTGSTCSWNRIELQQVLTESGKELVK